MSRFTEDSQPYRRARRRFLDANPVCWICEHPGANQVDHDPPISLNPGSRLQVETWRPAHGHPGGCPTCGRYCNQEKGARPLSSVVRAESRLCPYAGVGDHWAGCTLTHSEDWYACPAHRSDCAGVHWPAS